MAIADRAAEAQSAMAAERLIELAQDASPQVRRQVAANPYTPAQVITVLAGDRDWRTRAVIAARPAVPAGAATRFVDDRSWQVRFALAKNQHSDPGVLLAITQAADNGIRMVFAQNTWLPENIANVVADDQFKDVRSSLAVCTTHRRVLERLLTDPHPYVRADAIRNRLATTADLIRAAQDRDPIVRAAAAISPKLPDDERRRLAGTDRSSFVRDEAARNAGAAAQYPHARGGALVGDDEPSNLTDLQKLANWPVTVSKPSTKWLKLFSNFHPGSDVIPDHVAWFWRYSTRIDRDPAWLAWWRAGDADRLDITIVPGRTPGTAIDRHGSTVHVRANSTEVATLLVQAVPGDVDSQNVLLGETYALYLPALIRALSDAATYCGLPDPPPLPAADVR